MMERRRCPKHVRRPASSIGAEVQTPSSSRPRCSIEVSIVPMRASGFVETSPAIPHILIRVCNSHSHLASSKVSESDCNKREPFQLRLKPLKRLCLFERFLVHLAEARCE